MQKMSNFHQGSSPKDAHQQLGKQDEEFRERRSLQVHSSSKNNQEEDFSEDHSPLMHMSSENKIQQQQEPQLINGAPFQQGYPLKDSDYKESTQISSHSQQTLVTTPQGYPPKDGSPLNHQSSYPDLQQKHSSTKISTSQEHSSKGDHLTNTQNTNYLLPQKLLPGATLVPLPQQQPPPISAPPKNNHPRESNKSSHQSHKEPSPVTALSERHLSEDEYTAGSRNFKNLQQQQPSDCLQGEPAKQVYHPKHSTIPMGELNTSCAQEDSKNVDDPHRSKSSSTKPSTQGHGAPPKSEEHESVYQKTDTKQKDEALTKKVATNRVELTAKNIRVQRTQLKSSSGCTCSVL